MGATIKKAIKDYKNGYNLCGYLINSEQEYNPNKIEVNITIIDTTDTNNKYDYSFSKAQVGILANKKNVNKKTLIFEHGEMFAFTFGEYRAWYLKKYVTCKRIKLLYERLYNNENKLLKTVNDEDKNTLLRISAATIRELKEIGRGYMPRVARGNKIRFIYNFNKHTVKEVLDSINIEELDLNVLDSKKYDDKYGYIFYDGYDREHDAADQNDWDCKETLDDVTNRILKSKHNEDND